MYIHDMYIHCDAHFPVTAEYPRLCSQFIPVCSTEGLAPLHEVRLLYCYIHVHVHVHVHVYCTCFVPTKWCSVAVEDSSVIYNVQSIVHNQHTESNGLWTTYTDDIVNWPQIWGT